jgi:hypothetical protein
MRRVALVIAVATGMAPAATRAEPALPAGLPPGIGVATWTPGSVEFTPTVTPSGTPLRWTGGCVFLRPHTAGAVDLPAGALEAALAAATAAWRTATGACSYLELRVEPAEAGETGFDYVNRIVVRAERWCRPGPPEKCHDPSAVGLTTVFYLERPGDPDDGVIVDADIELNAVDFALATCHAPGDCVTAGAGTPSDLTNLLTHELGHLLGLDHTCWPGVPGEAPLDGDGVRIPSCSPSGDLPPEIKEATMYNFTDPGEIAKRTPEPDDIAGVCARYPSASDPGTCAPVGPAAAPDAADPGPGTDSGGCTASRGGGLAGMLGVVVVLAGLVIGARRGARCPRCLPDELSSVRCPSSRSRSGAPAAAAATTSRRRSRSRRRATATRPAR